MKKIILAVLILLGFSTSACKKEYKELGTPYSQLEGINSKWVLSSIVINDVGGIVVEKVDMTYYYTSGTGVPNITFEISGTDTIFSCDTVGLVANVFGLPEGRWRFDNNEFPSKVLIMDNDKTIVKVFNLINPIKTFQNNLLISERTYCGEKVVYSYDLVMNRIIN